MDFKKILNNKVQASINLIHIQEEVVGEYSILQKDWKKNQICKFWHFAIILVIIGATKRILMWF